MPEPDQAPGPTTSVDSSSEHPNTQPNKPGEAGDVAFALQGLVDIQDHDDIERDVSEQVKAAAVEEENKKDEGRIANLRARIQKLEDQKASLAAQKDQKERARVPRPQINVLSTKISTCAEGIANALDEITAFEDRIEERNKQQAAAVAAAAAKPRQSQDGEFHHAGPQQLEGEDRQAFLIRTGKITPFAGLGDVEEDDDDGSAQAAAAAAAASEAEGPQVQTSHQVLRQPGFAATHIREPIGDDSTAESISSNLESEFGLRPRKRRRTAGADVEVAVEADGSGPGPSRRKRRAGADDDEDFIADEGESDVSDGVEAEIPDSAEEQAKGTVKLSIADDANPSVYNARLETWVRERRELRESLGENDPNPDEEEWHKPTPGKPNRTLVEDYSLPEEIHDFLFPFQRVGIKWLAQLHRRREGGILCDEMGLGKTGEFQYILTPNLISTGTNLYASQSRSYRSWRHFTSARSWMDPP